MGRISIQVSVPPQRAISNDIQSIVLMNRSMTKEFSNYNQDTLEELFIKKKLSLDNLFLDSLASDTTLKALSNALYQSGRFDVVIPVKRNLQNNNRSFQDKSASLTLPQVKQICNEFNVDALLLLENFEEKVKTSYQIFPGNMFNGGENLKEYTAYIQVAYHSNWKLYQPLEKLMAAGFEVKDTIYFERRGNTLQETYEELPTIKEALLDGAIENGENLASYISPGWKSDQRRYFLTGNNDADKAVGLLKQNDWQEAKNIWLKFSNSSSDRFRSMIEYNLALASEMTGDLKEAISWAKKSHQSRYSKAAEDYLRLLNDRLVNN
jgi:hypothetical protein